AQFVFTNAKFEQVDPARILWFDSNSFKVCLKGNFPRPGTTPNPAATQLEIQIDFGDPNAFPPAPGGPRTIVDIPAPASPDTTEFDTLCTGDAPGSEFL